VPVASRFHHSHTEIRAGAVSKSRGSLELERVSLQNKAGSKMVCRSGLSGVREGEFTKQGGI
jgi:hypothetical protein